MSLSSYQVERPNPESLLMSKEETIEIEGPVVVGRLPDVERVYRRPVDVGCERFTRNRLRFMPEVETMDETWREIIRASNMIRRAETRQRQLRRG